MLFQRPGTFRALFWTHSPEWNCPWFLRLQNSSSIVPAMTTNSSERSSQNHATLSPHFEQKSRLTQDLELYFAYVFKGLESGGGPFFSKKQIVGHQSRSPSAIHPALVAARLRELVACGAPCKLICSKGEPTMFLSEETPCMIEPYKHSPPISQIVQKSYLQYLLMFAHLAMPLCW